jgi:hypothetical protein
MSNTNKTHSLLTWEVSDGAHTECMLGKLNGVAVFNASRHHASDEFTVTCNLPSMDRHMKGHFDDHSAVRIRSEFIVRVWLNQINLVNRDELS